MITPLGLGEPLAAGEGPRGSEGVQGSLGPGIGEPYLVKRRDTFAKQLGQPYLGPAGGVVCQALRRLLGNGPEDRFGAVTEDHGGHGVDEVEPVDAVGVNHVTPRGGLNEDGVWIPEDRVAAVSPGEVFPGVFPKGAGVWSQLQVAFQLAVSADHIFAGLLAGMWRP